MIKIFRRASRGEGGGGEKSLKRSPMRRGRLGRRVTRRRRRKAARGRKRVGVAQRGQPREVFADRGELTELGGVGNPIGHDVGADQLQVGFAGKVNDEDDEQDTGERRGVCQPAEKLGAFERLMAEIDEEQVRQRVGANTEGEGVARVVGLRKPLETSGCASVAEGGLELRPQVFGRGIERDPTGGRGFHDSG